jgi:agmatine deiminase
MRFRSLILLILLIMTGSLIAHNIDNHSLGYAWDYRFTETPPPSSPVRPIAEFEPASHVLIRYPLGIPSSLVVHLSNTADVICFVNSNSTMNSATTAFNNAGVNMDRVSFMIAATDSYWTRDFGPWFIFDGNGDYGVVDFRYNRPRPNDNMIPQLYAQQYDLPYYGMSLYQTGGNYMTDGINTAAQTDIAYSENSNNSHNVNGKMQEYLGITSYHVLPDPNNTYIDHIDCWGKFLAPDKVLIRSVPSSHSQYNAIEATAAYFAGINSAWGYPYEVYRVYTPNNQPYTNSLILNNKVFVPQMNSTHDAAALQVYRDAMPGYEVIGVTGPSGAPWEATDALHCRTHEVPDADMLHIAHQPYYGIQQIQDGFVLDATITAHSGAQLYADSLYVRYRINSEDWQYLALSSQETMTYSSTITNLSVGDTIRYYIHAADQSGRSADHPVFAELDPHLFVIEGDAVAPWIEHNPIVSIGWEETTFLVTALDDSGIASVNISYRIDNQEVQTAEMIDAGNGMYLFLYNPEFMESDQFFYYQVFAEDSYGNIGYLPAMDQWYSVAIQPSANDEALSPSPISTIKLYPNPARQQQSIRIAHQYPKASLAKLQVFNMRGQLVYEQSSHTQPNSEIRFETVDKNGQKLGSGLYFIRLNIGQNAYKSKLIIAN